MFKQRSEEALEYGSVIPGNPPASAWRTSGSASTLFDRALYVFETANVATLPALRRHYSYSRGYLHVQSGVESCACALFNFSAFVTTDNDTCTE